MLQKLKNRLKNQRGMTLVELLAVIVILGIISAIAVPSIIGVIDNAKKDAQIANAQQMANSAKTAVASGDVTFTTTDGVTSATLTLNDLVTKGYMETVKNPNDKVNNYNSSSSFVKITKNSNGYSYFVTLVQGGTSGSTYFSNKDPENMTRTDVTVN